MNHGEVLWPETILQRDSNPWPPRWRRSALPTVLWKPIHLEQTDLLLTRESNEDQCHLRRSTHNTRLYPTHMGLFIYQLLWTQSCPEGMCTNGTQVPCEVPSLPNPTTRKGWPHHLGLRPLLFSNSDVGSFTSHKNKSVKELWDETYGFSSLSEKTRKSNHLFHQTSTPSKSRSLYSCFILNIFVTACLNCFVRTE